MSSRPLNDEIRAAGPIRAGVVRVLDTLLVVYQRIISPAVPATCRFEPSCSQYARDALRLHGPFRGIALTLRRLSRCHPLGGSGYDPVHPPGGGTMKPRRNG